MAWTGIWTGASDVNGQSGWDDDHANKMRTMASIGRAIFLFLLLMIFPGRSSACSLLGELVQASTHILIGHVADKEAYDSSRTDFSIRIEEQIKGSVEGSLIHLTIPSSTPEILPSYWASEQLIDRFGRYILQKSARVLLFLRQEEQDFTLTRINWSVFAVEDGMVWGLNVPVSDFVHEVRARVEGFISPNEPGLLMRKIAEGTSHILIVRRAPRIMTEDQAYLESGFRICYFKIEEVLWRQSEPEHAWSISGMFIDSPGIFGGDMDGENKFVAFAELFGYSLPSTPIFTLSCRCTEGIATPFGMLWIREGKAFPFDISVEDLTDEIVGLKDSEVAVKEATWGQLKALFRR